MPGTFYTNAEIEAARAAGLAAAFNRAVGDGFREVLKRCPYQGQDQELLADAWRQGVRKHFTINANWPDQDKPHSGNKAFTDPKGRG